MGQDYFAEQRSGQVQDQTDASNHGRQPAVDN